jgi:hypothetical protein
MESIDYYKNDEWGYKIINDYLRNDSCQTNKKIEKHIENIDFFINLKSEIEPITLYRGFRSFFDVDSTTSFVNLGYSSCSTDIDIALRFSGIERYILQFELPGDVRFYKYDDKNSWLAENEYLLQRGLQFTITGRHDNIFYCKICRASLLFHK